MVNKTGGSIVTAILLFACLMPAIAQPRDPQPLIAILSSLEKKFAVAFTYADETVGVNIKVNAPPREATLDQCLQRLQEETGLMFEPINQRYIAITRVGLQKTGMLCGYLRSSETGEPVSGATIQSGTDFTYSNDAGYFELEAQPSLLLSITSLGYESANVSVPSGGCKTIVLPVARTLLEEVTVADVITTGMERKSDGSITFNHKVLGILPGLPQPDAIQALQYVPGVNSIMESAAELNIRGGTNDQNLYLLDGIKLYQTGHFFGLISGINPHVTKNVNLIKNGSGAYFGDGVSGTVSIVSENNVATSTSGSLGMNLLYTDGYVHVPLSSNFSLQLSGRHSLPAAWRTPTYQKYFSRAFSDSDLTGNLAQDEDFEFYDGMVKILCDITPRDKLRASFFNITNTLRYAEAGEQNGSPVQKESTLEQQSLGGGLTYSRLWNNRVKTVAEGYYSKYALDAVNQNIAGEQTLLQQNTVLETGLKIFSLLELKPHAYLQAGYQFVETGITNADEVDNPPFERRLKDVMRTHAVFAEGNFSWNDDRTKLRLGVRSNYYSKVSTFTIEPRMVLTQAIAQQFTLEVMGEMKSQSSVQVVDAQSDFLGVEKSRWVMSNNEDIPLVCSRQFSAGLLWKQAAWFVHTEVYAKQVRGIQTSSQGFQNQFEFVRSQGAYTTAGVDALINRQSTRSVQWLRYTVSKNEYDFSDLMPAVFPNNTDIRHALSGGISYRFSKLEVGTGVSWYTGRPTTALVPGNEVVLGALQYGEPNSANLANYFRVDASARWHFYTRARIKGQLGISCWNIFNRKNVLNAYYLLEDNTPRKVQLNGLAFTPNIFLRVDF